MIRPVILTVDDDPQVLDAIRHDLKRQYGERYRVMAALGPDVALETARGDLKGSTIALFLVDYKMPGKDGIELLTELRELYPDAKKVLLTAYADTEAAIAAINQVGLDHYLMKPWDPPEEKLYPILDDLLEEWAANVRLPYDGIRIAGSRWAPASYAAREFLARNQVPYKWVDMDEDGPDQQDVKTLGADLSRLPVIVFDDRSYLTTPTRAELAAKLALHTLVKTNFYDLVIVGGGPAGLASAVYGASEGLNTLLVEQEAPGGQAGTSSLIENYLGFPRGVSGAELARRAADQAKRFGAEVLVGHSVVEVRRQDPFRIVTLSNGTEVSCHALVVATGLAVRELPVSGIEPLLGAGVYYGAATTEAVLYRDQDVCVVGGANSAGQGALFLARYARTVTLTVRAGGLEASMSRYLIDRVMAASNITVLTQCEITGVSGEIHLERVELKRLDAGSTEWRDMAALFIFIGVAPHTQSLARVLQLDERGFIVTGPDVKRTSSVWTLDRDPLMFETSVPGVFAVGDVRAGANRRIAAAVGEGSAAIFSVHQYLQTV